MKISFIKIYISKLISKTTNQKIYAKCKTRQNLNISQKIRPNPNPSTIHSSVVARGGRPPPPPKRKNV